jgi:hypothetical protein
LSFNLKRSDQCSHLQHSPENLAERTGFEPARENPDCLANNCGYRFAIPPKVEKILERAIGFEPMMIGFADQRLIPLGDTR